MAFNPLQFLDNPAALWFLLAFIPFILLYLIKPKPNEKVVPSLMFLVKELHTQKSNSFFQRFLRDLLVFLHILILLFMCVAAMHPFYNTQSAVAAEFTVLVIDNSASMNTNAGLGTRLDDALSEAKDHLEGKISIILAQNDPFVVLQDGDKEDALKIIGYIRSTDTLSALGSSILAADDLLQDKKGKIVVISDFINTDPLDPYIAKKSLEAKGHTVEFIPIRSNANNVGIVGLESVDKETIVTVQNYNDETAAVDVSINDNKYHLEIPANWQDSITFQHWEGTNTIKIEQGDDFAGDNKVQLLVPLRKEASALVITNNAKSFVYPVIQAYAESWNDELTVEKGEPPVMPVVQHDIIVLTDVDVDAIPGSVIGRIKEAVSEGSTLIVTNQDDLEKLNLDDILPVTLANNPVVNSKTEVEMKNVLSAVTEGVSITSVDKYMQATAKENTLVLAATPEGVPILALGSYGEGTVVYYGIFETNSTFKYDVTYPLFWLQLIDYVIGKDTIESLNYKIGEKVVFDNEIPVIFPSGREEKMEAVVFEEIGLYEYKNRQVSVNLLNKVESNVDYVNEAFEKSIEEEDSEKVKTKKPLTKIIIIAVLVLLFLELLYVKVRGDF